MEKYLSLTSLNAADPLPALGKKVERKPVAPCAEAIRQEAVSKFEQGDHTYGHWVALRHDTNVAMLRSKPLSPMPVYIDELSDAFFPLTKKGILNFEKDNTVQRQKPFMSHGEIKFISTPDEVKAQFERRLYGDIALCLGVSCESVADDYAKVMNFGGAPSDDDTPELETCPYCGCTVETPCDEPPIDTCEKALNATYS